MNESHEKFWKSQRTKEGHKNIEACDGEVQLNRKEQNSGYRDRRNDKQNLKVHGIPLNGKLTFYR